MGKKVSRRVREGRALRVAFNELAESKGEYLSPESVFERDKFSEMDVFEQMELGLRS